MSLIQTIRTAIVNNTVRNFQYEEIMRETGCTRHVAKTMMFSFLYYATEDYLQDLLTNSKD
ncbi:MAG: hypothetical protein [Bacteriophage sp.]|nr:MAG: hypothetical protein [Bacteriophage sp.]